MAEAFHALGNTVVIAGRRAGPLEAVAAAHPGMMAAVLDVADAGALRAFAGRAAKDYPALNVLIDNAGIVQTEDGMAEPFDMATYEATVAINLVAPIRLAMALLPQLRRQARAAVVNVTSGPAFVPRAVTPTYGATKAAMPSRTQSMRQQLRGTAVQMIELVPPLVATDLTPGQRDNPRTMPLDAFIRESMALFAADDGAAEIPVERVKPQRGAEARLLLPVHDELLFEVPDGGGGQGGPGGEGGDGGGGGDFRAAGGGDRDWGDLGGRALEAVP